MSDSSSEEIVQNVDRFARSWAYRRGIRNHALIHDIIHEAWVAALENNYSLKAVVRAIDRFRKREYRAAPVLSGLAPDFSADWFGEPETEDQAADRGLHADSYHGWCQDDV